MKRKTFFGCETDKLKSWFLYWISVGVWGFVLMFLVTTTWIGVSVHEKCLVAQGKYGGECVDALISTVQDESNSLRMRNYSIWALGQMGDPQVLPVLEDLYTGTIPRRESYDGTISQYELKKAINLLKSGLNISAFVWRR